MITGLHLSIVLSLLNEGGGCGGGEGYERGHREWRRDENTLVVGMV